MPSVRQSLEHMYPRRSDSQSPPSKLPRLRSKQGGAVAGAAAGGAAAAAAVTGGAAAAVTGAGQAVAGGVAAAVAGGVAAAVTGAGQAVSCSSGGGCQPACSERGPRESRSLGESKSETVFSLLRLCKVGRAGGLRRGGGPGGTGEGGVLGAAGEGVRAGLAV